MHDSAEPPYHRLAVASLVLTGLGFSFLPVLGTIAGLVVASRARRRLAEEPGRWRGEDLVKWSVRLGVLGLILWLVVGVSLVVTWWFLGQEPGI